MRVHDWRNVHGAMNTKKSMNTPQPTETDLQDRFRKILPSEWSTDFFHGKEFIELEIPGAKVVLRLLVRMDPRPREFPFGAEGIGRSPNLRMENQVTKEGSQPRRKLPRFALALLTRICHFCCMASYQTAVHLWPHPESGFWYLVWRESGNPKRRSTRTKKYAEAQAILEATFRHIGTTPRELPNPTFHQGLGAWFEDRFRPLRGLAIVTIKKYETFVSQVKQVVPSEVMAADIRSNDVRKILDVLQRKFGLSPSTVNRQTGGSCFSMRFQRVSSRQSVTASSGHSFSP
jgi:hypothetical protein